ncbi:MAG: hypothetical protein IKV94_02790 [Clostridia bacterium]|nr:hypothetical protein [Clostridia bacterium]MBR6517131.1 hypothetical protein [Bacilli bacterium]
MSDDLRFLFSDKALAKLGFKVKKKPSNKEYAKLRTKLKTYPIISWFNRTQPIYEVDYDFLEEFINCKDFQECGHSKDIHKFRDKYLHRISVLPFGGKKRTYYKMVTDWDERMIDKSILNKEGQ